MHDGQLRALDCTGKIIGVIAGAQSGKTVFGPIWLLFEMLAKGPGEYGVVSPTFALLRKKALREFLKLFRGALKLGTFNKSENEFVFSEEGLIWLFGSADQPCTVIFGYAENPDSLESMTLKAVWCDEAGQRQFKADSYYALLRRLSIHQGRMLITTTPYDLGWLKTLVYDRWVQEPKGEVQVIQFKSVDNPAFPLAEYEAARTRMPKWKFDLFYNAIFTKPAGTIIDCFNEAFHVVPDFTVPKEWERPWGMDFGQVNTACVKLAINPDYDENADQRQPWNRRFYLYQTYKSGNKTVKDHVKSLFSKERPGATSPKAVGGAPSEDGWRDEYASEDFYISRPSISDVELGIDAIYDLFSTGELAVMASCTRLIADLQTYSRELDANEEPTEKIRDKATYHRIDALRYVASEIRANPSFVDGSVTIDTYED